MKVGDLVKLKPLYAEHDQASNYVIGIIFETLTGVSHKKKQVTMSCGQIIYIIP
jgi:hypothetical protein